MARDLGGRAYRDDDRGCRCFSPAAYADLFAGIGRLRVNSRHSPDADYLLC